jgi:hypothetical protein
MGQGKRKETQDFFYDGSYKEHTFPPGMSSEQQLHVRVTSGHALNEYASFIYYFYIKGFQDWVCTVLLSVFLYPIFLNPVVFKGKGRWVILILCPWSQSI